jgi:hypothetical protein
MFSAYFALTPKSKANFEEIVEYVQTFSSQPDARTSEVFQGMMTLLHNAMDELGISQLPRRGAWGSVTATSFIPVPLRPAFEGSEYPAWEVVQTAGCIRD